MMAETQPQQQQQPIVGIPLQSCVWTAFPPTITGVPVPLRRCLYDYTLVKCRSKGCNTLLPNDLVWCYFHKPQVIDLY